MPAPVLQFKRGNAGVAGTVPALRPGEPAISLNNFDFFIGIDTSVANNKFFGSHRYWGREDGTNSLKLKLVDKDGTNYVAIKAPDTLGGDVTYQLPGTQGAVSSVLTNDGNGNLTWASGSLNPTFSGIATFTDTTDNTLGNPDTGAVQIDGGLGINKNVTIGAGLSVTGESHFIGTATFHGGTLNLGDSDTDDIVFGGEIKSNLIPTDDATYNLGTGAKRWNNASFAGIVTANTFSGSLSGNASSADQVKTVSAADANANYYVTFVDTNNGSATNENVYTDDGIYYNPGANKLTTQNGLFTGNLEIQNGLYVSSGITTVGDLNVTGTTNITGSLTGTISTATRATLIDTTPTINNATYYVPFVDTLGGQEGETLYVGSGLSLDPSTGNVGVASVLSVGNTTDINAFIKAGGGSNALYLYADGQVAFQNKAVVNEIRSSSDSNTLITLSGLDARFAGNVAIAGITTIGTGVGITQFSSAVGSGTSTSSVPTSSAVIDYVTTQVGNVDLTLGISADTGGPSTVNTSQTLTISGTANEVETSVSGQTITVGLPDAVIVGTSLSAPTVKVATIQHSNGTQAATIDSSGNITASQNLTVQGDLYVNGSTTQINTTSLTVEDRTIELGMVDGAAPTGATTWDLGVLFNYYTDAAKKSAVVWEHVAGRFQLGSVVTDGGGTGSASPQLTVSTFAPIEVAELWVNNTCSGGAQQVIGCVGAELQLQNITIDAGTF